MRALPFEFCSETSVLLGNETTIEIGGLYSSYPIFPDNHYLSLAIHPAIRDYFEDAVSVEFLVTVDADQDFSCYACFSALSDLIHFKMACATAL